MWLFHVFPVLVTKWFNHSTRILMLLKWQRPCIHSPFCIFSPPSAIQVAYQPESTTEEVPLFEAVASEQCRASNLAWQEGCVDVTWSVDIWDCLFMQRSRQDFHGFSVVWSKNHAHLPNQLQIGRNAMVAQTCVSVCCM